MEHVKPQGVAHHWVLMIGLFLEWIILYSTFSEIYSENNTINYVLDLIIVPIITSLIFHQILIFRNFTISDPVYNPENEKWKKNALWCITFLIFIGIGAVAGEFGYLFAISKLSNIGVDGGLTSVLMDVMQTNTDCVIERLKEKNIDTNTHDIESISLKLSLKGIFVIGAILVCILVICWDLLIKFMTKKFDDIWNLFLLMDIFSLVFWILLSTFIIPRFKVQNMDNVIMSLVFIVLFYMIIIFYRVFKLYSKVKSAKEHTSELAL